MVYSKFLINLIGIFLDMVGGDWECFRNKKSINDDFFKIFSFEIGYYGGILGRGNKVVKIYIGKKIYNEFILGSSGG